VKTSPASSPLAAVRVDHDRHEVSGAALPEDHRHVGPLLGNDELKLVLDARGAMHDFTAPPAWPPPRIVWTGRRHNQRIDRYNSNLFEYGFFDLRLLDEDRLPPVTAWRQRLHPTEGWVETVINRQGGLQETAVTFLCLPRNLLVCRRRYTGLPAGIRPAARAVFTFCQVGADAIPFRSTWVPQAPRPQGIAADFTTDGHRLYRGLAALFSDRPCRAAAAGHRLELEIPLSPEGEATLYLALEDDLGSDPQLVTMHEGDWMPAGVRQVHRDNVAAERARPAADPAAAIERTIREVAREGFASLWAGQRRAWSDYHKQFHLELPAAAGKLVPAVRGAIYHCRCGYSRWDWGSSPFNNSWGAHYAWNERYPTEGLLAFGVDDMPRRVMEWRRSILPFLCQRAAARGAFYHHSCVEPGTQTTERNATSFFEMFLGGLISNYMEQHVRYTGDDAVLRRYYPVMREIAEFFRQWLLVELPGNNLMVVPLIDVNESVYPVQDGHFTICSAARAFDVAARAARRLGEDADLRPAWERTRDLAILLVRHQLRAHLPADGCYQDLELDSIPEPALKVDEAIRAWRDAYKARFTGEDQFQKHGQNVAGDFSKPRNWPWGAFQQVHLHATLGQPEKVMAALERGLRVLLPFGGQCESAEEDFSRIDHPWFTTASGTLLRGVARMCLFPQDDDLYILPGIPSDWRDLAFELPAHGAVSVAVAVRDGRLTRLALRAQRQAPDRRLRVHIPRRFLPDAAALRAPAKVVEQNDKEWVLQIPVDYTGEIR